jgi:hypothetical protein
MIKIMMNDKLFTILAVVTVLVSGSISNFSILKAIIDDSQTSQGSA